MVDRRVGIVGVTNSVTLLDHSRQFSSRGYSGGRGGGKSEAKIIRHDMNMRFRYFIFSKR
jgi:hypothetical protein